MAVDKDTALYLCSARTSIAAMICFARKTLVCVVFLFEGLASGTLLVRVTPALAPAHVQLLFLQLWPPAGGTNNAKFPARTH